MESDHYAASELILSSNGTYFGEIGQNSSYESYVPEYSQIALQGESGPSRQPSKVLEDDRFAPFDYEDPVFHRLWSRIWLSERYRKYRINSRKPGSVEKLKKKGEKPQERWIDTEEQAFWIGRIFN